MTDYQHNKNPGFAYNGRSLFGRRQRRPQSALRSHVLEKILPKIKLADDKLTLDHTTHPSEFFAKAHSSYWLEIGFGQGEHVVQLIRKNPDTAYIGAEPFVNGMSSFLKKIKDDNHDNIRVLMDDGMIAARSIAPQTLDGIYILNPDPWHKKRHYKRRIISQRNLDILAKILKPGKQLIMTTDVESLAEWMCTQASNHPEFKWKATCKDDWCIKPEEWITTRYEIKGAKGAKKMAYLFFERT